MRKQTSRLYYLPTEHLGKERAQGGNHLTFDRGGFCLNPLSASRASSQISTGRKLTFFGHTCRSKCTLMKNILQGRMEGKRQRGRPRINYFDNIKSWTQMTTREIYDVILERDVWRQMVHEAVRAANVLGNDAG
ncbi:endonuclease-reverse transcriptase [Plakobranchus ocellatus]|uniref:Endonuclease-reverse transcriptase n=1 Tax=Plakobranchus ocellatus TaxID=259542 RepID=A0AAV4DFM8_9GAST|nr:endonuclease-reverse transcriptase [Plakobranchus ocellatus]